MSDGEIIAAITAAGDKQEATVWDGNTIASQTFSSASVGYQVTYTFDLAGGSLGFTVSSV